MVEVIIKGSTLVKDAAPHFIMQLKNLLTFENPKWLSAKRHGTFVGNIPQWLYYYKAKDNSVIVPKGMTGYVLKMLDYPTEQIIDQTTAIPIEIEFTGKLRDYQEDVVKDMMNRRYGIVEAATGSGKTVMGIAYAAKRKLTTLVVVHNKELLNQWVDRFSEFTTLNKKDIGIIGNGKFEVKDVTIGIINSISKSLDVLKDKFSLVIYDECHRAIGSTWVNTINSMQSKYHIGLSATPYRSDGAGMTKALFRIVGPMIHKVDRNMLEKTGAVLTPRIIRIPTRFTYNFNKDYAQMLNRLSNNEQRNILIANHIIEEFKTYKEPIMVVSDRVSHCDLLKELLMNEAGITPVVLSGKVPKAKRVQAVEDMKAGKYNTLIATVSLLGEGFDAPDLNSVFLTTPVKFQGRTIQTIGRIIRPSKGGQPKVYDFRDNLIPVLRYSGFSRDRVYKHHNWG
jgi:superfamily II DNA or RNA helicase